MAARWRSAGTTWNSLARSDKRVRKRRSSRNVYAPSYATPTDDEGLDKREPVGSRLYHTRHPRMAIKTSRLPQADMAGLAGLIQVWYAHPYSPDPGYFHSGAAM